MDNKKIDALSAIYNTLELPFVIYNNNGEALYSFPPEFSLYCKNNPTIITDFVMHKKKLSKGSYVIQTGDMTWFGLCKLDSNNILVTAPVSSKQKPDFSPLLAQTCVEEKSIKYFYNMINDISSMKDSQLIAFISMIYFVWNNESSNSINYIRLEAPDSDLVTNNESTLTILNNDIDILKQEKTKIAKHIDYAYLENIYKAIIDGEEYLLDKAISAPHTGKFGLLSHDNLQQLKYESIISLYNAGIAATKAGMNYDACMDIVDTYSRSIDTMNDMVDIKELTYKAYVDLCSKIYKATKMNRYSIYTKKAVAFIEQNIFADIRIEDLNAAVGINGIELNNLFEKDTEKTITEYIIDERLKKSLFLLSGTEMTITEIALLLNFENQTQFTNYFVKTYGMTPGKYRVSMA